VAREKGEGLEKYSNRRKINHFHIVPRSTPFLGDYSQEKSVPKINLLEQLVSWEHSRARKIFLGGSFPYVTFHSLPCYESLVHLASPQRSLLRSYVLTSCYLLSVSHGLLFFCHRLWRLRRLEAFPEKGPLP
jgi:hypothetical protein